MLYALTVWQCERNNQLVRESALSNSVPLGSRTEENYNEANSFSTSES